MPQTVQTTTLQVTKPLDFHLLEATFKLIRYELPPNLRFRNNRNDYGQMHNCLRDRLNYAYRTFKFDRLDNNIPKWVVYALYPHEAPPQPITIPFLIEKPLPQKVIRFDQLDFHVLLKLLQIDYFRRGQGNECFVGQDDCYVYARKSLGTALTCLCVNLQGNIRTLETDRVQEFKVVGQATPFRKVEDQKISFASHAYFGRIDNNGQVYFVHLKTPELSSYPKDSIYEIRPFKGHRTTLNYHDMQHLEESTGKILYDFHHDFSEYLETYGITCASKTRTFTKLEVPKDPLLLPIEMLRTIYVYDNRLQRDHPLEMYLDILAANQPAINFVPTDNLAQLERGAALIIQDYNKEDFEEKGIFFGKVDLYQQLYRQYPFVPKQTMNVNPHKSKDAVLPAYLNYPAPKDDKDFSELFHRKIDMTLYELYLKDVILNEQSLQRLPYLPSNYAFIRKATYAGVSYETMLYFEDDTLRFINIDEPDGPDRRNAILQQFGIDWEEMYTAMLKKYKRIKDDEIKALTHFDVIVGPNLFVELEAINERVLYPYDDIVLRKEDLDVLYSIDDLLLTPHYDQLSEQNLSEQELHQTGLLNGERIPNNPREEASLQLYLQCEQYDTLLEEIRRTHPMISYNTLTQGETMERIARIFNIAPNKNGRYNRLNFIRYYQKLGMFKSPKGRDIEGMPYKGIWYDQEFCYLVGATTSMPQKQPRAHIIRQFDVYIGKEHFDPLPLLLSASVQFVRLKQYTVYPYPFHLINLYVENVLHFQK
jgi:hypothetical protein